MLATSYVVGRGETLSLVSLTYGTAGAIRLIAFGSFLGVASAAVFWCVAGRYVGAGPPRPALGAESRP